MNGRGVAVLLLLAVAAFSLSCGDSASPGANSTATRPVAAPPASGIDVPEGFGVFRYAEGLDHPVALAFHPGGSLWVATSDGRAMELADADGDRRADRVGPAFASGASDVRGIGFDPMDGTLFIAGRDRIIAGHDDDEDDTYESARDIIARDIDSVGTLSGVSVGRDGRLYFGGPADLEGKGPVAAVLTTRLDGDDLRVFAEGLRDPRGITFAPDGNLYITDEAPSPDVADGALDELNRVVEDDNYGWPHCAGAVPVVASGCEDTRAPVAQFDPSLTSSGLGVYGAGPFPEEYWAGGFIARSDADGGRIVFVRLFGILEVEDMGDILEPTVFASGFRDPRDIAVGPDGALYVADSASGIVYVIVHLGDEAEDRS